MAPSEASPVCRLGNRPRESLLLGVPSGKENRPQVQPTPPSPCLCFHPSAIWAYLLSSLVTRTRTASTSCPTASSPGLILTEVHSEGWEEVTSASVSLGVGSGTLFGFLGEVGSSAERTGPIETAEQMTPPGVWIGCWKGGLWATQMFRNRPSHPLHHGRGPPLSPADVCKA